MINLTKMKTCAFIGHKKIDITEDLKRRLTFLIEDLIINQNVGRFFFGSRSFFDDFALEVVSQLKKKYSNIQRVYVRAEYDYVDYKHDGYEETFFPDRVRGAGRKSYVVRNEYMIDESDYVVFYYNENYKTERFRKVGAIDRAIKSGTTMAFEYAQKKKKQIFNLCQ